VSYNLQNMPTLNEIDIEMLEEVVYGWKPVYGETIIYEEGTYYYSLRAGNVSVPDINDIMLVKGTFNGTEHTFVSNTDYVLVDTTGDGKYDTMMWIDTASLPDDGTDFIVDYRYQIDPSGLTDVSIGSVLRYIVETFGSQIFRAFLNIESVGRDSYIDTAIGTNLDKLALLVGATRSTATRSTGYVILRRDPSNITPVIDIPIGTRLGTVTSSTNQQVLFQTTKPARIRSGEITAVTYTDTGDTDHLQEWVPVQAVSAGIGGNVASSSIIQNINAPQEVIYVYNPGTYDRTAEQVTGDGTTQAFELSHPPSSTSSRGIKYLEYKYGFISQPSVSTTLKITLDLNSSSDYANPTEWVTVTINGLNSSGEIASEAHNLDDTDDGVPVTTTTSFSQIDYVTFINHIDNSKGIGEGTGANSTISITNTAATETYLDDLAPGTRVDGGVLDMVADDEYISLYIWENDSWILKSIGSTGPSTGHYAYTDTGSSAGIIEWDDGLGGGSTWTEIDPYYTQYDAGPDGDGKNVMIEYYPIADEIGTGDATEIETGITSINITEEYKYGWLEQPASASEISISFTNGSAVDEDWDGTVVIYGDTTTGGEDDLETLTFNTDHEETTIKSFSKITHVVWSNTDNPANGPGETPATTTYTRIGTTTEGYDIMDESQCGTRVDSGYLSLIGVDSDTTLRVYVWNNGWVLKTQEDDHYIYTDEGTTAGIIDWRDPSIGNTWDWSTPPYVNSYDSGPYADGRNVKIEYVPISDQYTTEDVQLLLENILTTDAILTVSYTWTNEFISGSNTETDDVFRTRAPSALTTSAKATLTAIGNAVLSIPGIIGVTVDDSNTNRNIDEGEVHVFAWGSSGLLDSALRSLVSIAVNESRAGGVKPIVQSPTPIHIVVEIIVKMGRLSPYTQISVQTGVEDAIVSYINGLGINALMYKSHMLDAIIDVDGVKYVDISTLKIYGYNTSTATSISQEPPYATSPYWSFAEVADGSHREWSSSGNIINVASGTVLRADTNDDGVDNLAIDVTVEYE